MLFVYGFVSGVAVMLLIFAWQDRRAIRMPSHIWKLIADGLVHAREDVRKERERIDRLTEGLAQKAGAAIIMPQSELPNFATGNREIEKGSGWFDNKPVPVVPPKAPKPPSPPKG